MTPSSSSSSSSGAPGRYRSLVDLYEETEEVNDMNLFCFYTNIEPLNFEEARIEKKRVQAMDVEIQAIEKNDTWNLVTLPEGQKAIGVKWVFKIKKNVHRKVLERYKAKLVAKGINKKKVLTIIKCLHQLQDWSLLDC